MVLITVVDIAKDLETKEAVRVARQDETEYYNQKAREELELEFIKREAEANGSLLIDENDLPF